MKALTKRLLALGAGSVIAVAGGYVVAPWEGKENHAYRDMVGIPTVCYGFTHGVKMGDYYTDEQCDKQLVEELTKFNTQMKKNVRVPLSENEEVAYTSFVWNVGIGAWNSSTALKLLNAGDRKGACTQLLRWNKAGGRVVQGLVNRRQAEYKICMGNDADVNSALEEASRLGSVELEDLKTY